MTLTASRIEITPTITVELITVDTALAAVKAGLAALSER